MAMKVILMLWALLLSVLDRSISKQAYFKNKMEYPTWMRTVNSTSNICTCGDVLHEIV